MAIRKSAVCGSLSSRRQKPCSPQKNRSLTAVFILAVYAILSTLSTARAQDNGRCSLEPAHITALHNAAQGFFTALRIADKPWYAGELAFQDAQGAHVRLADFSGKTLLLNLWAVWCVPCRTEMPELGALKRQQGGSSFDVLAVNVDRSADDRITHFLADVHADNLAVYRDKSMKIFQELRRSGFGMGLPVTLVIDPQGCVLASLVGSAPWANADALRFIEAAIKTGQQKAGK